MITHCLYIQFNLINNNIHAFHSVSFILKSVSLLFGVYHCYLELVTSNQSERLLHSADIRVDTKCYTADFYLFTTDKKANTFVK